MNRVLHHIWLWCVWISLVFLTFNCSIWIWLFPSCSKTSGLGFLHFSSWVPVIFKIHGTYERTMYRSWEKMKWSSSKKKACHRFISTISKLKKMLVFIYKPPSKNSSHQNITNFEKNEVQSWEISKQIIFNWLTISKSLLAQSHYNLVMNFISL